MEKDMQKCGIKVKPLKDGTTKTLYLTFNRCEKADYDGGAKIVTILRNNTEQHVQMVDHQDRFGMRLIDCIKCNLEQLRLYYMAKKRIENNSYLTPKEKIIVEMHFGIWTGEVCSVQEICKMLDIPNEEVRRAIGKATRKVCRFGGLDG